MPDMMTHTPVLGGPQILQKKGRPIALYFIVCKVKISQFLRKSTIMYSFLSHTIISLTNPHKEVIV